MLKKLKFLLMGLLFPLALGSLSGCSFFTTNEENGYLISDITAVPNEDGDIVVTITYDDEDVEPVVFIIPNGEDGAQGTGISEIVEVVEDGDEENTTIRISYTDEDIPPTELKIPNGSSIWKIEKVEGSNPEIMRITLTDGSLIDIEMPVPNGIKNYETILNKDGSITFVITFTNGESISIPIPKGEKGVGIADIQTSIEGDYYVLKITLTDGTKLDPLKFPKPADANTWLSGQGKPSDTIGKNGDFFFDTANLVIYGKENGSWVVIHNFGDSGESYKVSFKLNDSNEAPASLSGPLFYEIDRGNYFASHGYSIPIPTRPGFTFNGWYTTATPNATNGAFTDLTPVFSDLTLFANWIEII